MLQFSLVNLSITKKTIKKQSVLHRQSPIGPLRLTKHLILHIPLFVAMYLPMVDWRQILSDACYQMMTIPIPGLYAAGEITGLYYGKYPGGTSVLRGLVFGKRSGEHVVTYFPKQKTLYKEELDVYRGFEGSSSACYRRWAAALDVKHVYCLHHMVRM